MQSPPLAEQKGAAAFPSNHPRRVGAVGAEPCQPKAKTILIVGAGPAGLLLAHHLLSSDASHRVWLVDQRPEPKDRADRGRGFVISLSARGQAPLKAIQGLWPVVAARGLAVTQSGIYSSKTSGWQYLKRRAVGVDPSLLIHRNDLCRSLIEALAPYGERCRLSFNERSLGVDLHAHALLTMTTQASLTRIPYDLLVGADGIHSVIRGALLRQPGFDFSQRCIPSVWKSIHVPRPPGFLPETSYFFKESKSSDPSPSPFLAGAALPATNDRLCLLTFWSPRSGGDGNNPAEIKSPDAFQRGLAESWLPGLVIPHEAARAWFDQTPSRILENRCSRYHDLEGQVVLIGDAAHGMSSALAQGCQAGFSDAVTLSRLLTLYPDDLPRVLQEYSRCQVPEGHAVTDLNAMMRPASPASPALSRLLRLLTLWQPLATKHLPRWIRPDLFIQLARPDIPYTALAHQYRIRIRLRYWIDKGLAFKC